MCGRIRGNIVNIYGSLANRGIVYYASVIMPHFQLSQSLEEYEAALKQLELGAVTSVTLLEVLTARDRVEAARTDPDQSITSTQLLHLSNLDQHLQEQAESLSKGVDFARLRSSVSPSETAWWWNLDQLNFPYLSAQHVWLWKSLSILTWTANLGLLLNIAGRFLTGGPSVGGAIAIALPSILALLQAKNGLTDSGLEGFKQFLKKLGVPKRTQEKAQFISTLGLFIFLLGFWLLLPTISDWYNQRGLKDYQKGKLGSATQNYQRAIALNSDNVEAHYNLGKLYEDLQEFDSARREYLFAVQRELPEAYNNLARLNIQDKKYPQAAALLQKGLQKAQNAKPEVKYSLFKNLGWVRFEQKRDTEAQNALQAAIGIASNQDVANYIKNPGSAHCLMAQVLERSKQPGALTQWQQCQKLGNSLNPDEDTWLHLAQGKLTSARKKAPKP